MKFQFKEKSKASLVQKRWNEFHFDGNTFTTRMDPDTQAVKYPTPNPLYGRRNRVYDVEYLGGLNDADTTVAVATLDRSGAEYKLFDAGTLPLMFAYLGLGMEAASKNDAYNQQFVNVMQESLSAAYATQLTDLAFLTAEYVTTLPRMETGNAAMIGYLVWYQSVVQNIAAVMAKYNATLSLVDYLVQMGYNGEAPQMTALTNLYKKQNLYSLFDQVGVIISQEFLDLDWYREVTVLNGLPSRIADDVQSPMLTITGSTYVPGVTVKVDGTVVFDTINSSNASLGYDAFNKIVVNVNGSSNTYSFQQLVQHIMESLDPVDMLAICRQIHEGVSSSTVVAYVNDLIECMKALVNVCSYFKNQTVDLRTYLMLLQNSTNLNRWVFGTPYTAPSRPRIQTKPEYVRVIHDIFRAYGTNGNMVLDTTTRKWKVFTLWKGGDGIAEYDAYNGGFAIATSVRTIPDDPAGYLKPDYMFPRMFYRYEDESGIRYQRFVNRLGTYFQMGVTTFNATQLRQNPYFAYVNAIDAPDASIQVPTATLSSVTTDYVLMSAINKLLVSLFGYGIGKYGSGSSMITNYAINTDNIMLVGRQFGNFSEASIEYLTARAPMRQIDKQVNIGFRYNAVTPDKVTGNWDGPQYS